MVFLGDENRKKIVTQIHNQLDKIGYKDNSEVFCDHAISLLQTFERDHLHSVCVERLEPFLKDNTSMFVTELLGCVKDISEPENHEESVVDSNRFSDNEHPEADRHVDNLNINPSIVHANHHKSKPLAKNNEKIDRYDDHKRNGVSKRDRFGGHRSSCLYISDIPEECNNIQDVAGVFSEFGKIKLVTCNTQDRFAIVEYFVDESVTMALQHFCGNIKGYAISLSTDARKIGRLERSSLENKIMELMLKHEEDLNATINYLSKYSYTDFAIFDEFQNHLDVSKSSLSKLIWRFRSGKHIRSDTSRRRNQSFHGYQSDTDHPQSYRYNSTRINKRPSAGFSHSFQSKNIKLDMRPREVGLYPVFPALKHDHGFIRKYFSSFGNILDIHFEHRDTVMFIKFETPEESDLAFKESVKIDFGSGIKVYRKRDLLQEIEGEIDRNTAPKDPYTDDESNKDDRSWKH